MSNSPVTETGYSAEYLQVGVYSITTTTRYNAAGQPLTSVQKRLISQLSPTLESKSVFVSERSLTSTTWSEYSAGTKRVQYSTMPTSSITAETVTVSGVALSQKDTAGITTTATRSYTANGMVLTQTDGRGNTTTTVTDKAGRALMVTDAAGNVTTTVYCDCCDQPATITDAQGNTTCYRYDLRGRKVAEWGTGIQPAVFGYDDAGNMFTLTTFRHPGAVISTDPAEWEGLVQDTTTWTFDPATGLELSKTYADNTAVVKTYDAHNRLATETNARGRVKVHSYEHARGLLLNTTWYHPAAEGEEAVADSYSPSRSFTYNHLGQLTQVVENALSGQSSAGAAADSTRTIGYNQYGEQETDSLVVDNDTQLITETRDAQGRSTGYVYSKNGTTQQTVCTGYGTDGRIASAGFLHGGVERQFTYAYLPGTHLLQTLTKPNNMTLTQSYETQRDLLTGMLYKRGNTAVAQRTYTYDTLGRPLTRSTARNGQTVNDTFGYNNRSELTTATVNGGSYAYDYDNIGNRAAAVEDSSGVASRTGYVANNLNQYTALTVDGDVDFQPEYDADGNQCRVKTSTGIWVITYNAENRPTDFTSQAADGTITSVHCEYDYMGRRTTKMVTVGNNVTLQQRYIYRGYLQIACIDLTRSHHPALWFITWDPTQPVATRPLAIQKDGSWFTYGWDLTKNICELYGPSGYIRSAYTYSPYGQVTSTGDVEQTIQWSSEAWDEELGLIYYNWRYYQAFLGKWTTRDPFHEMYDINLYSFIRNNINNIDSLGTKTVKGTLPLWRGSGTVAFSFDVSFRRNCVEVTLVLDLAGRDSSIENKFEREILSKWSNTHGITCGNSEVVYPITFKIKWMRWWRFFTTADQKITAGKPIKRKTNDGKLLRYYNMLHWPTDDKYIYSIGHEFGHMVGNDDNYRRPGDPATAHKPEQNTVNDIMNKASAPTSPDNYAKILEAIKEDLPKLSHGEYKVIKL